MSGSSWMPVAEDNDEERGGLSSGVVARMASDDVEAPRQAQRMMRRRGRSFQ